MWFSEVFFLSLKTKPTPQAMNLLNLLNQTTPHSVHFTHAAEHPMHSEFNPESFEHKQEPGGSLCVYTVTQRGVKL